jgi:hypothetical protein
MDQPPPFPNSASQKKGLGPLAWIGIGCGSIVVLGIIAVIIAGAILGPKIKQMGSEFAENPTRASVNLAVKVSGGELELVAEDDVNKRYTIRDKQGNLTTFYWDEKTKSPQNVKGDFSAIPAARAEPDAEAPPAPAAPSQPQ